MCLPHHQAGLGVVAAVVDQLDAKALELGDQGREVLVALVDGLVAQLLCAALVELLLELVGQALAVLALVLDDGDLVAELVVDDVVGGVGALDVVAAAGAEDVVEALLGELRVGRGRGDLQHALVVVHARRRDRARRAEVPVDEHHALVDELVGHRHRLLRVAGVVTDLDLELLAADAALGVQVLRRQLGAALHLLAEDGVLPGDRAGDGDGHVGVGDGGEGHRAGGAQEQRLQGTHLSFLPIQTSRGTTLAHERTAGMRAVAAAPTRPAPPVIWQEFSRASPGRHPAAFSR